MSKKRIGPCCRCGQKPKVHYLAIAYKKHNDAVVFPYCEECVLSDKIRNFFEVRAEMSALVRKQLRRIEQDWVERGVEV